MNFDDLTTTESWIFHFQFSRTHLPLVIEMNKIKKWYGHENHRKMGQAWKISLFTYFFLKHTKFPIKKKLVTIFRTLYSVQLPNIIDWLPLLLEILGNVCIVIICYPVCDVINFEIKVSFAIKPFSYVTKKSRQKFKLF